MNRTESNQTKPIWVDKLSVRKKLPEGIEEERMSKNVFVAAKSVKLGKSLKGSFFNSSHK